MGSVLIELSEAAQARKAIYTPETYKSMLDPETPVRLRVIASEQNQKLIA